MVFWTMRVCVHLVHPSHIGHIVKASVIRENKNYTSENSETLTVHFPFASAFIYCFLCVGYLDVCSLFKWLFWEEHRIYDTELMRWYISAFSFKCLPFILALSSDRACNTLLTSYNSESPTWNSLQSVR